MISSEDIFLTVASQSSTSIGFSPSVRRMILRVQVFFEPRKLSCVWMPTIRASIAGGDKNEGIWGEGKEGTYGRR